MKKLCTVIITVFLTFILIGCNQNTDVSLKIDGVVNHTDAIIDEETRNVSFEVDSSVETFDMEDIIVSENIEINVYADQEHQVELGNELNLLDGLNIFYIKLSTNLTSNYAYWTLEITKATNLNLAEIRIKNLKDTYIVGEKFNNGVLSLIYEDETIKDVPLTADMVSGFDTSTEGEKTLTITYKEFTIDFTILVKEDMVVSIEETNFKYEYYLNESFEPANLLVTYESGKKETIIVNKTMVTGFDTSTEGEKTIVITHSGVSIEVTILVKEDTVVAIEETNFKYEYYLNESFEPANLLVTYESGKKETIIVNKTMVTGFDTSTEGEKTIVITYGGISIEVTINVIAKLIGIEVAELKDTYFIDEEFILGNLELIYQGKESETIDLTMDMVSGFDTSTEGEKTITITYKEFTIDFTILVKEDTVVSIEETNFKYEYYLNESFEPANLLVTYESGKKENIPLTNEMITGFDTSTKGEKTIEISYDGISIEVTILVKEDTVVCIEETNFKYEYYLNESFEPANLLVTYESGKKENIPLTNEMITGFDTSTKGEKTIVITYDGISIEVTINVTAKVIGIRVVELKDTYFIDEEFVSGNLELIYQDEESKTIDLTMDMVSGFDTSTEGEKTITITYKEFTIDFTILVKEDTVVSIEETNFKYEYYLNENFKPGNLLVTYESGKKENIPLTNEMITGFDTSTKGEKTIEISYDGISIEVTINVTAKVIGIRVVELKDTYFIDEEFISGNLELIYQDEESKTIDLTMDMVSGFDTSTEGEKTITITYKEFTIDFTILVKEDTVVSIEETNFKYEYYLNESFEPANLLVTYESGKKENIPLTNEMVTGFDTSTKGEKTIEISYGAISIEVTINVTAKVIGIRVVELKDTYFIDEEFVSGKLELIYQDEESKTIDLTMDMVSGFDTSTEGEKTLTITYRDLSTEIKINVFAKLIAISVFEFKNVYLIDQEFIPGKLELIYQGKDSEIIELTEDMVTGFDTSTEGEKVLIITYEGLITDYIIIVREGYSNSGTHTYRQASSFFPEDWNPFTYEEAAANDYILNYTTSGLYRFDYNEDRTSFNLVPDMAVGEPKDVTSSYVGEKWGIKAGSTARAWEIPLRDDLKWDDGTVINAQSFVDSLKLLLDPTAQNLRTTDYTYNGIIKIHNAKKYLFNGVTDDFEVSEVGFTITEALEYATENSRSLFLDYSLVFWSGYNTTYKDYFEIKSGVNAGKNFFDVYAVSESNPSVAVTTQMIADFNACYDWQPNADIEMPSVCKINYTWPELSFDEVGIKANGNKLTYILDEPESGFYLKYHLNIPLVHIEKYKASLKTVNGVTTSTYGTSVETYASYGPYKLETFEMNSVIRLVRNENWYGYNDYDIGAGYYQTDIIETKYIADDSDKLEEFVKGNLDSYDLTESDFPKYGSSKNIYYTNDTASTFFIAINPYGSAEDATTTDKVLSNLDFRKALSFSVDRKAFALACAPMNDIAYSIFSGSYVSDPELGKLYGNEEAAKDVILNYWGLADQVGPGKRFATKDEAIASITGADLIQAKEKFNAAAEELIFSGTWDGNSQLEIIIGQPSEAAFYQKGFETLSNIWKEAMNGTAFEGKVEFKADSSIGNGFGDALRKGDVDILFGVGWQGSELYPYVLVSAYTDSNSQYDSKIDYSTLSLTIDFSSVTVENDYGREVTLTNARLTSDVSSWADVLSYGSLKVKNEADGKTYTINASKTASYEVKVAILAAVENAVLQQYTMMPLLRSTSASLKGFKVNYGSEKYVFGIEFGGVKYYTYNYDDEGWAQYVEDNGGILDYTK